MRALTAGSLISASLNIVGDVSLFIHGNTNGDDELDISDAVTTLNYLFLGEGLLECPDAADANDDGQVDISDPVTALSFLYLGGPAALFWMWDVAPESLGSACERVVLKLLTASIFRRKCLLKPVKRNQKTTFQSIAD